MAFRPLVTIGTTILPEPSIYNGNTSTVVDSGRNAEGRFIGAVIRDDMAKIELSWNYLTVSQWALINKLFKGKFINSVTFFDQAMGEWTTREMYVNDRSAGLISRDTNGNIRGWQNCKLSLIEA